MHPMRIALCVEYDGSAYHGWQSQPHGQTVQDTLEHALAKVAGTPLRLNCAGRTDTGVHGLAQIVHFDCDVERPDQAWVRGGNAHLPPQIAVPAPSKSVVLAFTSSKRPSARATSSAVTKPNAVRSAPSVPTRHTVPRFTPAPSATTPTCKDRVVHGFSVAARSAEGSTSAIARPRASASHAGAPAATSAAPASRVRGQCFRSVTRALYAVAARATMDA